MKKNILCIILSIVMVMSIMTNLNIITIHAIDEYDPRISLRPKAIGSNAGIGMATSGSFSLVIQFM